MEKRSLIALALAVAVLLIFQYYFSATAPQQRPRPAEEAPRTVQPEAPVPKTPAAQVAPTVPESGTAATQPPQPAERFVTVDTPFFTARLSTLGGTIAAWELKQHKNDKGENVSLTAENALYRPLSMGWSGDFGISLRSFTLTGRDLTLQEPGATGSLVFTYRDERVSITRTYVFSADGYDFELVDEVTGAPAYQLTLGDRFGMTDAAADRWSHRGPVVLVGTDRENIKPGKLTETRLYSGDLKWVAQEDKYFFSALVPRTPVTDAAVWKYQDGAAISFRAPGSGEHRFLVYSGPKAHDELKGLGVGLEHIVDFGFFSVLARPIFWLMKKFHSITGNYGWAIVILTIVIRVPFIPIVHKGQKSMKRLQELQPRMQEIKEKHKKDPQRMQKEMMELYKKHKVNPMGGCLPMVLQIPVFFALYKVLLVAIELRGAPWALWITDLSKKDPYYVLPIIMGLSMLLQQRMTPTAGDPRQQKIMMFMPIVFTFMFLSFPSGLVLYWLVNNVLSIAQQVYINRKKS